MTISLEDEFGGITQPFEAPVWFADIGERLPGFKGVLDQAVLDIDMPPFNRWIEINL